MFISAPLQPNWWESCVLIEEWLSTSHFHTTLARDLHAKAEVSVENAKLTCAQVLLAQLNNLDCW